MNFRTVHVRVTDAATGRPTPARVRFTGPEGAYIAPFGRPVEAGGDALLEVQSASVRIAGQTWAYIDGECEVRLPPTGVHVEIRKGPEYRPVSETIAPGGKIGLRFALERWADLRAEGWYAGDPRVFLLTPHAALLEGAAEDVAVVNLLASEVADGPAGGTVPNLAAFSGQKAALERPGYLVAVNTYNRHPVLGGLCLLHCHRPVFPLRFGAPGGTDDWSLADWCGQCHRKGGLVVWPVQGGWPDGAPADFGEALANTILGQVDAFDPGFASPGLGPLALWYDLLNAGVHVPVAAGSGKASADMFVGAARTYALVSAEQEFSYRQWIEAVRQGRTFVTSGPLVSLSVAGHRPGEVVDVHPGVPLAIRAQARSWDTFERLEVVVNGRIVASADATGTPPAAALELAPAAEPGWVAARCRGAGGASGDLLAAHTSAVWVSCGGRYRGAPASAATARLAAVLERARDWVRGARRFESDTARTHLDELFEQATRRLSAAGETK